MRILDTFLGPHRVSNFFFLPSHFCWFSLNFCSEKGTSGKGLGESTSTIGPAKRVAQGAGHETRGRIRAAFLRSDNPARLRDRLFLLFPVIPKLLPFTFGENPLNSGQVVTVPCAVVEGDQPLKLRWTLNGHTISPHSGISIVDLGGRGAILSIGSVQATHAGTYTCIAENSAGRHELSADLIVNGA